ncbi:RHS repeat-associated core domain-containing protein [Rhodoferax sp. TBRC 17660]|uniref:RHS repeat-associated core domain-containing protein n=1 Tax=Rhodoferax potami TaxID=3068338 RepID=A0ABU3KRQ4_9BURK|nr:RHS repeat-associated core domain-containing protein [Rhodoferax sp. TBRC 17660]MDT7520485.1 RHS repeat-associated core domain-containing protein [Rhodoferax sp. TBRC 17660]
MCTAKPIIPATGEKLYTHSDYTDTGPHPLSLTRTYRSRWSVSGAAGFAANPGLGQAWAHNHSSSLSVQTNAGAAGGNALLAVTSIRLTEGNGSIRLFEPVSGTNQFKDSTGSSTITATTTLGGSSLPSSYTLNLTDDDSTWQFDASGKLQSKTERNGWTTSYSYINAGVGAGQLGSITNAFGRSIQLSYNAAGQLETATLPDGQTVRYTFDSSSRIVGVGYPGNVSKTYLYEDTRWPQSVTGIIDERGTRLATVVYDAQGRAVESGYAGGADYYKVSYPATSNWSSAQITDPLGTTRTYQYGTTLGKLTVTGADKPSGSGGSDAASRVQNASGLIDSETDFAGVLTLYTWDNTRRLPLSITQAAGKPEALTTSTQWHPTLRLPVKVTVPGKTTDTSYDARGNVLSQTETDTTGGPSNGQTRTWAWTYTPSNLVATHTDPLGQVWSYATNAQGQRTSATDPLGQTTSYTYDTAGRLSSQTEPGGLVTSYAYDQRGRITSVSAAGETTRYTYTPDGQLESATLPNGYSVSYQYDAAQRLIAASDNRGNRISYTLDGMGNRIREELKDPGGTIAYATSRTINSLNRVSSITSGQGASQGTTQYGFDANGEATSQTNALNHTTSQTLDGLRRPTATTLPDNSSTQTAWSALGDITSAKDPKGITTTYQRNAWGEVLSETSPDSGTQSFVRDAAGNITSKTDALGKTTTYTRNALGQVTGITLQDGTTQTLAYNTAGHLVQMTDASGSTSYTRDALGRILQKTQTVNDNPANPSTYTTAYTYHPGGQVASIRYPSGLTVNYRQGTGAQVGQITQVDVQEPGKNQPVLPWVTNLTYTALNQPKSWNWNCLTGNGKTAASTANCDTASRSFDSNGRMTGNEFATYSYDPAGRITGITQNLWALQAAVPEVPATATTPAVPAVPASYYPVPLSWTAGYDNRDRLTSFTRPGSSISYTYDKNSNRLSGTEATTSDTDLDGDFDAADLQRTTAQTQTIANDSNRLLGWSQTNTTKRLNAKGQPVTSSTSTQVNYGLDAAGNLTSDGLRTFSYDASNRLTQVQVGDADEASKVTYLHNAAGQRVFKSEPQVAQTAPSEQELGTDFITWLKKNFGWLFAQAQQNATLGQSYVYGDGPINSYHLLGEYGNGGTTSTGRLEYIYLPTETGTAQLIGLYKNNRFYAVHTDHLGTPRSITDDTNKVVWQWAYSAFGDNKPTGILKATTNPKAALTNQPTLLQATSPSFPVNLRFPGQYWDDEAKLSYNYFRNYQPNQGRYTQPDPIGLEGGWSRFGYVVGNALWAIDPEGLAGVTPKNFGKNKSLPPPGQLPKDTQERTKQQQEQQEAGAETTKNMLCYLGLRNCEAEDNLKKARICLLSQCTTCDGQTFTAGPNANQSSAFDPKTTTCKCIQYGFDPSYQGGPPPGLTPPGR